MPKMKVQSRISPPNEKQKGKKKTRINIMARFELTFIHRMSIPRESRYK